MVGLSLKNILIVLLVTLLILSTGLYNLWQHDKRKLKAAQDTIAEQTRVILALEAVSVRERVVTRVVDRVVTQISESPNAEILVPSDIAAAWATGIDGLRDDKPTGTAPNADNVRGPSPDATRKR